MRRSFTLPIRRGGFTLLEVMISLGIMSILMVAIGSALGLALRAVPDKNHAVVRLTDSGSILDEVINDLRYARHITEHTANAVRVVVPDRNGDGVSETIRYAWSGTSGDPLTRQYGSGVVVELLTNVHAFTLGYDQISTTEQYPGPDVQSAEMLLSSVSTLYHQHYSKITASNWLGQYFEPALPADAISWSVSRVLFRAKLADASSSAWVQLQTADDYELPTSTVLEQYPLSSDDLTSTAQWQDYSFSNAAGLSPGQGLCLVIKHQGGGKPADIHYDSHTGSGRLKTTNAGASWASDGGKRLFYYVYGTVTTPGAQQSFTRQYLTDISVGLQVGSDVSTRLDTAVQLVNRPEILAAVWELDFAGDPTSVDLSGDGGDWIENNNASFNPNALVNGIWQADQVLKTFPNNSFTNVTSVDVAMRNTTIGGLGAVCWINADWSNAASTPMIVALALQSDGTQTLSFSHPDTNSAMALHRFSGLPSGFVDVSLLIDPVADSVHLKIDGVAWGTYSYGGLAAVGSSGFATIYASGSSAEFDHILIRVLE